MSAPARPKKLSKKQQKKSALHRDKLLTGMKRDSQRHASLCRATRPPVEDQPTIEPILIGSDSSYRGIPLVTEFFRGALKFTEETAISLAAELKISDEAAQRLRIRTCSCGNRFLADHTTEHCSPPCAPRDEAAKPSEFDLLKWARTECGKLGMTLTNANRRGCHWVFKCSQTDRPLLSYYPNTKRGLRPGKGGQLYHIGDEFAAIEEARRIANSDPIL